jgi:hypothetical protein
MVQQRLLRFASLPCYPSLFRALIVVAMLIKPKKTILLAGLGLLIVLPVEVSLSPGRTADAGRMPALPAQSEKITRANWRRHPKGRIHCVRAEMQRSETARTPWLINLWNRVGESF